MRKLGLNCMMIDEKIGDSLCGGRQEMKRTCVREMIELVDDSISQGKVRSIYTLPHQMPRIAQTLSHNGFDLDRR